MGRTVSDGYYTDKDTGEVYDIPAGTDFITVEEREQKKKAIAYRKELEEKNQKTIEYKNDLCGEFFWSMYDMGKEYYPDVSDDMLVKIIYLLSYLDYKSNKLVTRHSASDAYRPMTKDDVKKVIRLHRCKFPNFWDKLMQSNIIFENEYGELEVSPMFCRGKVDGRVYKNLAKIKLYKTAIRYMYENTDVRTHKYLAYLYRLIPFINLKYNVLCYNQSEIDKHRIKLMTARELCEIVGIDSRRDNENRLIDTLFKLMFYDKTGKKWSVITLIKRIENNEVCQYITINPLFYAGFISQEDMVDVLNEFVIEDKEELLNEAS